MGVTLIGMPGSGKSSVGVLLAKVLAMPFVDTDIELQSMLGMTLQQYIDIHGYFSLRDQEARCILNISPLNMVVATGGSAVYSAASMEHLGRTSTLIFLDISLNTMIYRLGDYGARGIAADSNHGLADIYDERLPLYQNAAEHTVDANRPAAEVVANICELVR